MTFSGVIRLAGSLITRGRLALSSMLPSNGSKVPSKEEGGARGSPRKGARPWMARTVLVSGTLMRSGAGDFMRTSFLC